MIEWLDIDNLSIDEKVNLINELEKRKEMLKSTNIANFSPINQSQEFIIKSVSDTVQWKDDIKFFWVSGSNSWWKTAVASFILTSLALWELTEQIGARFLGVRKRILVLAETFDSIRKIEEYIISEPTFDDNTRHVWLCRIPPEFIETLTREIAHKNLKEIVLKNGTKIEFKSYSQWQKSIAGGNYDYVWFDEPPANIGVFREIVSRGTRKACIMLMSATLTDDDVYVQDLIENAPQETKDAIKILELRSEDNPYADTRMFGLLEESRKNGRATGRKGYVYDQFTMGKNVVEYFEPSFENMWGRVRYFMGIDPWANHPFAVSMFCIDDENNIYLFKEFSFEWDSKMTFTNVFRQITPYLKRYNFEKIVIDMRDKLMINEWKHELWLKNLEISDKHTKWPNWENNIIWRRMRENEFFAEGKIIIADTCPVHIRQFSRMKYKDKYSEKDTAKSDVYGKDDDCVDAFWYAFDKATRTTRLHDIWRLNTYRENEWKWWKNLFKNPAPETFAERLAYNSVPLTI